MSEKKYAIEVGKSWAPTLQSVGNTWNEQAARAIDSVPPGQLSLLGNPSRAMTAILGRIQRDLSASGAAQRTANDLIQCSPQSLMSAVLDCWRLGLDPSVKDHAYLVPYNKQVSIIPGWRGYVFLANRAGYDIVADCVYEGEDFELDRGAMTIRHVWNPTIPRVDEKLIAAYAVAYRRDTTGKRIPEPVSIVALNAAEIDQRRPKRGAANFWTDHYPQMCRKTVIRALVRSGELDLYMDGDVSFLNELSQIDHDEVIGDDAPTEAPNSRAEEMRMAIADVRDAEPEDEPRTVKAKLPDPDGPAVYGEEPPGEPEPPAAEEPDEDPFAEEPQPSPDEMLRDEVVAAIRAAKTKDELRKATSRGKDLPVDMREAVKSAWEKRKEELAG